jgi:hypothetical protein
VENHGNLLSWQANISVEWALWGFAEALSALLALEPLDAMLTVVTGLHHYGTAVVARHFSALPFGGQWADNANCGRLAALSAD